MSTPLNGCAFRAEHRHLWVVSARKGYHDPGHDMRWVTSKSSTVYCPKCGRSWRTSALYVDELPDSGQAVDQLEPRMVRIQQLVEDYPLLAELTYISNGGTASRNRFLTDVGKQLLQYGSLTERQMFAAEGVIQKQMVDQAKTDQSLQDGRTVPQGRHRITGRIVKTWVEDKLGDEHIPRVRMELQADEGYVVECTLPKPLRDAYGPDMAGYRITVELLLKPAWGAEVRAWGSWPRDAEVIA